MDLPKIIAELRREREEINQAIDALEHLQRDYPRRRAGSQNGRPKPQRTNWAPAMDKAEVKTGPAGVVDILTVGPPEDNHDALKRVFECPAWSIF